MFPSNQLCSILVDYFFLYYIANETDSGFCYFFKSTGYKRDRDNTYLLFRDMQSDHTMDIFLITIPVPNTSNENRAACF